MWSAWVHESSFVSIHGNGSRTFTLSALSTTARSCLTFLGHHPHLFTLASFGALILIILTFSLHLDIRLSGVGFLVQSDARWCMWYIWNQNWSNRDTLCLDEVGIRIALFTFTFTFSLSWTETRNMPACFPCWGRCRRPKILPSPSPSPSASPAGLGKNYKGITTSENLTSLYQDYLMVFVYCCLPISRANSCENVLESHPCGCICTSNCTSLSSKSVLSGSCGSCGSLQTYHWPESCHVLPMFLFCCQFRISCSGMFSFSTSLESFLGSLSFFDLPRRQWQKMVQPHEFAEPVSETKLLSSSSFAVVSCHESSTLKVSEWGTQGPNGQNTRGQLHRFPLSLSTMCLKYRHLMWKTVMFFGFSLSRLRTSISSWGPFSFSFSASPTMALPCRVTINK